MSTSNIIDMEPDGLELLVTFRVHGAEGERTYRYDPVASAAILLGADPAGFLGERTDESGDAATAIAGEIADVILDVGEVGAL